MDATACNGSKDSSPVFYLVGIPTLQGSLFLPVFFIFLFFYLLILVGNALILVAVVTEPRLHKPMYFFLINLSALDILFTTTTVPKMLSLLLLGDHVLSFPACFLQMYLFHSFSCAEAFILVVMAYDRYVAICRPLHYPVHMTPQTNAALAASAWLAALLLPIPAVAQTSHMAFASTVYIYHCFCDHLAVVQASCSDTTPRPSWASASPWSCPSCPSSWCFSPMPTLWPRCFASAPEKDAPKPSPPAPPTCWWLAPTTHPSP